MVVMRAGLLMALLGGTALAEPRLDLVPDLPAANSVGMTDSLLCVQGRAVVRCSVGQVLASKADLAALLRKADLTALQAEIARAQAAEGAKADAAAVAGKASQVALDAEAARAQAAEAGKADATTLNGLATFVNAVNAAMIVKADGAATTAALAGKVDAAGGTLTGGVLSGGTSVNAPLVWLNPSAAQNTTYQSGGITNGVIIAAGGNRISYCPVLSCITAPSADHQRAGSLFWSTTSDDGHSEEQTVAIETIVATGYAKPWAPNTAFAVGDNVRNFGANAVYRATVAGTSAGSGSGPSGTGSAIADGTVTWTWINASAIDAKVGLYNEEAVVAGGGNSWVQANNVELRPGMTPSFNINTELDFTNNAADCALGVANCNSLEMNLAGTHTSTTGIHLGSTNGGATYAALWGIRLNGSRLASLADIEVDSGAPVGLGFNASGLGGSHATATIVDASTGLNSILISGLHSGADINVTSGSPAAYTNSGVHVLGTFFDNSNSPLVVNTSGNHAAEVWNDASTSPAALNLGGTYSLAAISTQAATTPSALVAKEGQNICFNGGDACLRHAAGKLTYSVGGVVLFSVADSTGNAVFRGTVTGSGAP